MRNGKSEGKYASMRTSWASMQQPGKRKTNAPDPSRISCQNSSNGIAKKTVGNVFQLELFES
ncbi:hypothetical protein F4776DRAFT_667089 [Hypoxylon sp. NC0597]|nr:hypothetical protein F4776DRAFT_667089 [Hypoxylon sp. NC0597]